MQAHVLNLLASSSGGGDSSLFLGDNFFPWMILAFGAAMVVGNVMAVLRPPSEDHDASRPPMIRVVALVAVGLAASAWGLASLLA